MGWGVGWGGLQLATRQCDSENVFRSDHIPAFRSDRFSAFRSDYLALCGHQLSEELCLDELLTPGPPGNYEIVGHTKYRWKVLPLGVLPCEVRGACPGVVGAQRRCSLEVVIPGSSFGRKKVPDLNPAKFSAVFRTKRRRPEKTSGSKILKNRDDKRLDHTQGNCLCAASSFSGAHSNLPVPIALAHLPNGLRAEPSQNISILCPSKDFQEETNEDVEMNSSFSATVSLKYFFYKVGCSP